MFGATPSRLGLVALVLGILVVVAVGCGPFVDPASVQGRTDTAVGPLGSSREVSEEFVGTCDGLTSLEVQLAAYPDVTTRAGQLQLTVTQLTPDAPRPLAAASFDERGLAANQWLAVTFPTVTRSSGERFILRASSTAVAPAPFTLWSSSHLESPTVQLREDGQPRRGALTLHAACDESAFNVAESTWSMLVRNGWLWPTLISLCLVSGLGVALWTAPAETDPAALLGYAAGWSVLLAPLALAVASIDGLGALAGPSLIGAGGAASIWRFAVARSIRKKSPTRLALGNRGETSPPAQRFKWVDGSTLIVLIAVVGAVVVRTAIARSLVLPMWVDSVQHSYIAKLIVDQGGIPATYGSAMPTEAFDYHFAFHAIAAFATWISGAPVPTSVLATGQVLGFLLPLAVYSLGRDLTSSAQAGAVAAVLVGVVTTQPTYYATWGRYPELAGLVALPAAFAALRGLQGKSLTMQRLIPAATAGAAMPLVHPRVAIFLAALIVADVIATTSRPRQLVAGLARLAGVGALAALLISPWILRQWSAHHSQFAITSPVTTINFPFGLATAGDDRYVLGLALLGLAIAAVQRFELLVLFGTWAGIVVVAANPATFHLPIHFWLNDDSVAIALFLPTSILVGYAVARLCAFVRFDAWPSGARNFVGGLAVAVALSQIPPLLTVVNPCCYLGKSADLTAMAWISQNTPANARFIVNGYEWSPNIWAGDDAGYWIPVIANRATTLPPLFYANGPRAAVGEVNRTAARVTAAGSEPSALFEVARDTGAGYVYVGTQGGPIDPFRLLADPRFRLVYRAGGAWVFAVDGGGASTATTTGMTPTEVGWPSDAKAAGLKSVTSG